MSDSEDDKSTTTTVPDTVRKGVGNYDENSEDVDLPLSAGEQLTLAQKEQVRAYVLLKKQLNATEIQWDKSIDGLFKSIKDSRDNLKKLFSTISVQCIDVTPIASEDEKKAVLDAAERVKEARRLRTEAVKAARADAEGGASGSTEKKSKTKASSTPKVPSQNVYLRLQEKKTYGDWNEKMIVSFIQKLTIGDYKDLLDSLDEAKSVKALPPPAQQEKDNVPVEAVPKGKPKKRKAAEPVSPVDPIKAWPEAMSGALKEHCAKSSLSLNLTNVKPRSVKDIVHVSGIKEFNIIRDNLHTWFGTKNKLSALRQSFWSGPNAELKDKVQSEADRINRLLETVAKTHVAATPVAADNQSNSGRASFETVHSISVNTNLQAKNAADMDTGSKEDQALLKQRLQNKFTPVAWKKVKDLLQDVVDQLVKEHREKPFTVDSLKEEMAKRLVLEFKAFRTKMMIVDPRLVVCQAHRSKKGADL